MGVVATFSVLFFAASAVTFAGAAIIRARASRTYKNAETVFARAEEAFKHAQAERAEAQRIHAQCRPAPFSVPDNVQARVISPFGVVRRGQA
jgi:hypothetical protein